MATTEISWTQVVWNPTTGCDRVSPGCDHCYAMTMAKRLKSMGQAKYQTDGDPRTSGPGFGVAMHPDALGLPLKWRKPKQIFVNSMSDLFHEKVTDEFIARVFAVMAACPQHTFQLLTKRHARMRSLIGGLDGSPHRLLEATTDEDTASVLYDADWPLPNVHFGVSAEDQKWADIRIPALLDTPAAVRWISAEPMLGPIDLGAAALVPYEREQGGFWRYGARTGLHGEGKTWVPAPPAQLDWVVCGGESGPGARPMDLAWARSLRDQCARAGIPFHFKQGGSVLGREWGGHSKGGAPASWPEPFPREYPAGVA
jgi:protein gp37